MSKLFLDNWMLKLTSLLLAVLLEVYFYSAENSATAELSAAIEIHNLPEGKMIVWPPHAERGLFARVRVRGPAPLVEDAKKMSHRFTIDLPDAPKPSFSAPLNANQLRLPAGVQVLDIDPPKIDLDLERAVTKEVLVVVTKEGQPARGFQIESIKAYPVTVTARGPKKELDSLSVVETEKVDLSELTSSKRIPVDLVNTGPLTTLSAKQVMVEVNVTAVKAERVLRKVPIRTVAEPGNTVVVEPSFLDVVKVSGPAPLVEGLEKSKPDAVVDYTKLQPGKHTVSPMLPLPDGVKVDEMKPAQVTVTLAPEHPK